ncbi:hypothetical protein [Lentilactobacillus sp. Marseille-Q4993]|uniref:hypothetical protein n=1 Tax=Lentilactobacillus sp. Marseille-Q4993 TaxID=3039492 RepID=UPI0024BD2A1E|nr:hypothetical protein [Lentilactobacillus sp. Marseille-Q4993]
MTTTKYIIRLIIQIIIGGLIIIFVNVNSQNHIVIQLNGFNLWLLVSLVIQPIIIKHQHLFQDTTLIQKGVKMRTKQSSAKKLKWRTHSRSQYDLVIFDYQLFNDRMIFMANLGLRIFLIVCGPFVLLVRIIKSNRTE